MLSPTKDLLLRPKGSMTRQELQQVQAQRNMALGLDADDPNWGIKPNNIATAADVEANKAGTNGEVVTLADQKQQKQQDLPVPGSLKVMKNWLENTDEGKAVVAKAKDVTGNAVGVSAHTTTTPETDATTPTTTVDQQEEKVIAKPRVPGADIAQPSKYAIRKQSRDFADKVMNLKDIERVVNQVYPQQTEEDIETQERREKRNKLLATVGDGLSSFHEAYAKMRGVQPMTDGTSLTGRMRERRERLDRERQEIDAKRMRLAMDLANQKLKQKTAENLADYRQANIKKWEAENNALAEKNKLLEYKYETDRKYREGLLDIKKEEAEIKRQLAEGRISHWQALERLQNLRYYSSQQPTTTHTVRTDKDGNYAGESTTVRTKGGGGTSKKSGSSNKSVKKEKRKSKTKV